jgi:hypothetical protein
MNRLKGGPPHSAVVNISAEVLPQTAGRRYCSMHMDMNVFTMVPTMGKRNHTCPHL